MAFSREEQRLHSANWETGGSGWAKEGGRREESAGLRRVAVSGGPGAPCRRGGGGVVAPGQARGREGVRSEDAGPLRSPPAKCPGKQSPGPAAPRARTIPVPTAQGDQRTSVQ